MLSFLSKNSPSALINNVGWSLAGFIIPLLVGIIFIPLIIGVMGIELFGVLSIIWVLIGYFTLFDLGISRALTFLLSKNIGTRKENDNNIIYSTAVPIVAVMGCIGGVLFWLCSTWLSAHLFKVDPMLVPQVEKAFRWTAIAIPFTIWATALRSCLESYLRFKFINIVKLPIGAWLLIGPYVFYRFSGSFSIAIASLLIARILMFISYWMHCKKFLIFSFVLFDRKVLKEIFLFGGWMTVSNIISPIMVYFDRFLIGASLSALWVGYYSAPYEMVTKLLVIPVAASSVFFPAISNSLSKKDRPKTLKLIKIFSGGIALVMGMGAILFVVAGKYILLWWLGNSFEENSYWVMFWISIGVFFNALAQVPFSVIQATGDSKKTAIIHVIEAPVYLVAIFFALSWSKSISIVALVWCVRVFCDFIIMQLVSYNMMRLKAKIK